MINLIHKHIYDNVPTPVSKGIFDAPKRIQNAYWDLVSAKLVKSLDYFGGHIYVDLDISNDSILQCLVLYADMNTYSTQIEDYILTKIKKKKDLSIVVTVTEDHVRVSMGNFANPHA